MKKVDPKLYTKEYYLSECSGYNEYIKYKGNILEIRLKKALEIANVNKEKTVLDIGCGRGEIVVACAKNGAKAIGIDYSKDALELANDVAAQQLPEIKKNITFIHNEATNVPFQDKMFDVVFLLDVVEHLYPDELDITMRNIYRILKDDGIMIIHTYPNTLFIKIIYKYWYRPLKILLNITQGRKEGCPEKEFETDYTRIMHVNEQSFYSLKKILINNNFKCKYIPWPEEVGINNLQNNLKNIILKKLIITYRLLFLNWPLKIIFSNHIWVKATKNK